MTDKTGSKEREALRSIGEEQAFEAWFKVDCPVEGANAKIAAKAAWKARASLAPSSFSAADMATAAAQGFRDGVAALSANAGEPVAMYSIDADPQGIRSTVAEAITGALAFGALGVNQPPEGHWLAPFWKAAREDKEAVRVKRDLRQELQQQCSTWGAYWRGSDAHGVVISHPQAVELLQIALGVEVEIEIRGCQTCDYTGVIGDMPCPDCAAPPTAQAEGWTATAQHQTYRCKIKSRKQIDKEIPRDQQGWWADVAAGRKLLLRPAVQADIDRCHLGGRRSKNPDDYMCETQTNGSLVSKIALEYMHPEQNVFAAVPPPPTSAEGVEHG